ncbi:MAG: hypothetical protein QW688_07710 [Thermoprotei archaeon]
MMRTVEVILAVAILIGGVISVSLYVNLQPAEANYASLLQNLASSAIQQLKASQTLQYAAFNPSNQVYVGELKNSMGALFPANVVYNLTVYNVQNTTVNGVTSVSYQPILSFTDYSGGKPIFTYTSSFVLSPANFSYFQKTVSAPVTVYILNMSDAVYDPQTYTIANSLKQELTSRPYFKSVVSINNTQQFDQLMSLGYFKCSASQCQPRRATYQAQSSVIINTFTPYAAGDVPISATWAQEYVNNYGEEGGFAYYAYRLGENVSKYNITWVSFNYEFQRVSNMETDVFNSTICSDYPSFSIVGYCNIILPGCRNNDEGEIYFIAGITGNQNPYGTGSQCDTLEILGAATPTVLTPLAQQYANHYGVYPNYNQSSSEAYTRPNGLKLVSNVTAPISAENTIYYTDSIWSSPKGGFYILFGLSGFDARLALLTLLVFYHPQLLPCRVSPLRTL